VKDIKDANQHVLKEIAHFFTTYKQVQKKEVIVGEFEGQTVAHAAFDRARKMYEDKK
jgi:inorganic pyrophosphatase